MSKAKPSNSANPQDEVAETPFNPTKEVLLSTWGRDIDPELLVLALTHRSFANEQGGLPNNERLEFLGDSVLSIIVTEYLYRRFPDRPESQLSKMRSGCVSQTPLAIVARELKLGDYILLGHGEVISGGNDKDSILSDTLEALIGATYLCHGLEATRETVLAHLEPILRQASERGAAMDWKTTLNVLTHAEGLATPEYQVESTGPAHQRHFAATVKIDGKVWGRGEGSAKRYAERNAAQEAVEKLQAELDKADNA
ncbi:ribonuclease III [Boudabousia tangfeifanii]|uniref:Ribonuclease 3 n=1 Tax=Boudabousia tangfeifanii TaxID=1912795 RepID=A0A1D9ML01_9ACTO|nr:ribonuclease III [Boudabousia tangfeifanii]AOZ72820.1 ribonuclease III [Boudabousia tangfeifanii]